MGDAQLELLGFNGVSPHLGDPPGGDTHLADTARRTSPLSSWEAAGGIWMEQKETQRGQRPPNHSVPPVHNHSVSPPATRSLVSLLEKLNPLVSRSC